MVNILLQRVQIHSDNIVNLLHGVIQNRTKRHMYSSKLMLSPCTFHCQVIYTIIIHPPHEIATSLGESVLLVYYIYFFTFCGRKPSSPTVELNRTGENSVLGSIGPNRLS